MNNSIKRVLEFHRLFTGGDYLGEMFGTDASILRLSWDTNEILFTVWNWKDSYKVDTPPKDSIFRFYELPGVIWVGAVVSMAEDDRFADVEFYKDKVKFFIGKTLYRTRPYFRYPYICLSDSQLDAVEKKLRKVTLSTPKLFI